MLSFHSIDGSLNNSNQFWSGDRVNPAVWITIAFIIVLLINFAAVKFFGEFEFWLSSLKILIMLGAIILLFVLALGGCPG